MAEAITFDNAEAIVVGHLSGHLAVPVQRVVADPRPAKFVRVLATGAHRRNLPQLDAQITLECWAPTDAAAAALARDTYGWMCALDLDTAHVPQGSDGWLGGPYPSPDPESGTPRYVMTAIVRQRATTLGGA